MTTPETTVGLDLDAYRHAILTSGLHPYAQLLLHTLASWHQDERPSRNDLTSVTGISNGSLDPHLSAAEQAGFVRVERSNGGRNCRTRYILTMPGTKTQSADARHNDEQTRLVTEDEAPDREIPVICWQHQQYAGTPSSVILVEDNQILVTLHIFDSNGCAEVYLGSGEAETISDALRFAARRTRRRFETGEWNLGKTETVELRKIEDRSDKAPSAPTG